MHYIQYEELCRLYIANIFEISIEEVKSVRIPSPTHPNLVEYKNQIDLYWILESKFYQYVNIADVKWRKESDTVPIGRARELQFVRNEINNANKAILIANTGFDDGVKGVADKYGMGLHIVRPDFDLAIFEPDLKDRKIIQNQLQELVDNGKPVYDCNIVRRALDSGTDGTAQASASNKTVSHTKDIKHTPINRMQQTPSHRRQTTSTQKVTGGQSGSGTGRQGTSRTGRQGGTPSGRQGGSGPPKGSGPARGGGGTSNRRR